MEGKSKVSLVVIFIVDSSLLTFASRHFTPAWHTINMGMSPPSAQSTYINFPLPTGTGAVTLLFHSFPYGQSSNSLQYVALSIEFFNIVLFLLLSSFPFYWGHFGVINKQSCVSRHFHSIPFVNASSIANLD